MSATIGLSGGSFRGLLLDNEANADRQGSGFNPLCHLSYSGPESLSGRRRRPQL